MAAIRLRSIHRIVLATRISSSTVQNVSMYPNIPLTSLHTVPLLFYLQRTTPLTLGRGRTQSLPLSPPCAFYSGQRRSGEGGGGIFGKFFEYMRKDLKANQELEVG